MILIGGGRLPQDIPSSSTSRCSFWKWIMGALLVNGTATLDSGEALAFIAGQTAVVFEDRGALS